MKDQSTHVIAEIKGRSRRTASGEKFSVVKYRGEVIKACVQLMVLRMDLDGLDRVLSLVSKELVSVAVDGDLPHPQVEETSNDGISEHSPESSINDAVDDSVKEEDITND